MSSVEQTIFRNGSTTYYWGSRFFPKAVRADVFKLYSFLRVADDYVDSVPAQADEFHALRTAWQQAATDTGFDTTPTATDTIDRRVIKNIVAVSRAYDFEPAWLEAFWDAMQADLSPQNYRTLRQSLGYTYGSAEVVGLMMAKIMGLPPESYAAAKLQGRAMQWINFIRDVEEDNRMSRRYFPLTDLQKFQLPDLQEATARKYHDNFAQFMRFEIARYREWQAQAEQGMHFIPGLLRPALRTAAAMYDWTAGEIERDPLIVFTRKVKPTKARTLRSGVRHLAKR
jgi:phytoene synthase